MQLCGKKSALLFALGTLFVTATASAKVHLNSMCTMDVATHTRKNDDNSNKKYPLASISKLATSLWAVETLGADYRYTTKFHITKDADGAVDVHIEGGKDPIFGRNAGYFILTQLNRPDINVKKIRTLSFDENFLIEWNVEDHESIAGDTPYYSDFSKYVAHVVRDLSKGWGTPVGSLSYNVLRDQAADIGVELPAKAPTMTIEEVIYQSKADFTRSANTKTYIYQSAPLYKILKSMNNKSNNYIADHIYWNLGGTPAFNTYIKEKLSMTTADLEFNLGSGNNADYISNESEDYNRGTCNAMITVIWRLHDQLNKQGYRLSDILAVASTDQGSTLKKYGGSLAGATIAKTGTVNCTKSLAGAVSTNQGTIYFVVLVNINGMSEQHSATNFIKDKIRSLISRHGGPDPISYTPIMPLPFDKKSKLYLVPTLTTPKG
ncbi:MAG: D-alanyl-D-alanine carboxypeptidase [Bacillota bacterium]